MDARIVLACALLCTASAQSYGGGIRRVPGDFSPGRPVRPGGGFGGELPGGFPGGYPDRRPQRFPDMTPGSYPSRQPGGFFGPDIYPGGLPGGTNPRLCGDRICPIGASCVVARQRCVRSPCLPIRTCASSVVGLRP
ncbi:uncharacterized protein LOC144151335 isoform X2 [Haemaphysalis longicornis]